MEFNFKINNYTENLFDSMPSLKICSYNPLNYTSSSDNQYSIQNYFNIDIDNKYIVDFFINGKAPQHIFTFLKENFYSFNLWILLFFFTLLIGIIFIVKELFFKEKKKKYQTKENIKFLIYLISSVFLIFSLLIIIYCYKTLTFTNFGNFEKSGCQLQFIINKIFYGNEETNDWNSYNLINKNIKNIYNNLNFTYININEINNNNTYIIKKYKKELEIINKLKNYNDFNYTWNGLEKDFLIKSDFIKKLYNEDFSNLNHFEKFNNKINSFLINNNNYWKIINKNLEILQNNYADYIINENLYNFEKSIFDVFKRLEIIYSRTITDLFNYLKKINIIVILILLVTFFNLLILIIVQLLQINKFKFFIVLTWIIYLVLTLFSNYEIINFAVNGSLYYKGCQNFDSLIKNNQLIYKSIDYYNIQKGNINIISNYSEENDFENQNTDEIKNTLEDFIIKANNNNDFLNINSRLNELSEFYKLINKFDIFDEKFNHKLHIQKFNYSCFSDNCNEQIILNDLNKLTNYNIENTLQDCKIFKDEWFFDNEECNNGNNSSEDEDELKKDCFNIKDNDIEFVKNRYSGKLDLCEEINDEKHEIVLFKIFESLKNFYEESQNYYNELNNKFNKINENILEIKNSIENINNKNKENKIDLNIFNDYKNSLSFKEINSQLLDFKEKWCDNNLYSYQKIYEYFSILPFVCLLTMILTYILSKIYEDNLIIKINNYDPLPGDNDFSSNNSNSFY